MRIIITITFILFFMNAFPQLPSISCNQTTITPAFIIAPNFTTSIVNTSVSWPNDIAYLCGPNTVAYDTAYPHISYVLVDSGSTFITSGFNSVTYSVYYVKNNAKLILLPNLVPTSGLNIITEPTATVVNQTSVTINTQTCASISFPSVNCSVGIHDIEKHHNLFNIYPQPASNEITIQLNLKMGNPFNKYQLYNNLGQSIREEELNFKNNSATLNLQEIENGVYYIVMVNNKNESVAKKLVITR